MSEAIVQIGYDHKNTFLNNKEGPLADYVVFVGINTPRDYETYIVPVDIAEGAISDAYHNWNDTPKRMERNNQNFLHLFILNSIKIGLMIATISRNGHAIAMPGIH